MGYKIWQNANIIPYNIVGNLFGKPNFAITNYPIFVINIPSSFWEIEYKWCEIQSYTKGIKMKENSEYIATWYESFNLIDLNISNVFELNLLWKGLCSQVCTQPVILTLSDIRTV